MDVETVKCECCGLREDCTEEYIRGVRANFEGKWLCGLCSEAVRDEASKGRKKDEAVNAHISFCSKFKANPAVRVADGMRQMLRRRSGDLSSSPSNNFGRSSSSTTLQLPDQSPLSFY
ncbi:hypothetical protein J5N97_027532 [Dioscorea zingiberensis]|uniref:DUF1677 family protein n=1 Tax=Dioscorea zingiberensis TaxID=325984 RepID=A0A9D5H7Q4_9LILI|nr:hypothetical protein J5N97_027532 [Dioscorea zingiberensis]